MNFMEIVLFFEEHKHYKGDTVMYLISFYEDCPLAGVGIRILVL